MWYLAIDFGTTTSTGAIASAGTVSGLQVNGQNRVPSAVLLDDSGTLVAGNAAVNQAGMFPDRVDRTPKAGLGSPSPLLLGGQPVAATTAVAEVLRVFLDEGKRQQQGEPPVKVVVTHPARWSDARLDALRVAAREAGIGEIELCPEPVGAAVHYAEDRVAPGAYVGVYDFGGGTFDTAVLRRTADGFEWVGDAGGDDSLGGEDLDYRLYELVGELLSVDDPDLWEAISESDDRRWVRANADLQDQVRKAKEALSTYPTTRFAIPNSDRDVLVTREQFEDLIRDDIAATVDEMERTIRSAGIEPGQLDLLYLAGGSSRIPLVQQLMTQRFGNRVSTYADPKLVVSMGAARWLGERYGALSAHPTVVEPQLTPAPQPLPDLTTPAAAPPAPPVPPPPVPPPAVAPPTVPPPPVAPAAPPPAVAPAAPPPAPPPAAAPAPPPAAAPGYAQPQPAYAAAPAPGPGWAPAPAPAPAQAPAPAPARAPAPAARNPKALAVLLCGILSVAFALLGVVALVVGAGARKEIGGSGGTQSGGGMVSAGMALGAVGIVVWIAWAALLATA